MELQKYPSDSSCILGDALLKRQCYVSGLKFTAQVYQPNATLEAAPLPWGNGGEGEKGCMLSYSLAILPQKPDPHLILHRKQISQ